MDFSQSQILPLLLLLAAGQGVFLSILLLFSKNGNSLANRYLGLFTLLVAIAMIDFSIDPSIESTTVSFLRSFFWPRDFLFGPALYFYVREMTLPGRYHLLPRQWLHFLPGIVHCLVFWSLPLFNKPMHSALLFDDASGSSNAASMAELFVNFEALLAIVATAIYLYLSMQRMKDHRRRINASFSYEEQINLSWLKKLVIGVTVVYLLWVVDDILGIFIDLPDATFAFLGISMVVLVYAMSFFGLRQPAIFTGGTAELNLTNGTHNYLAHDVVQDVIEEPIQPNIENDVEANTVSMPTEEPTADLNKQEQSKYKSSSLSTELSIQLLDELKQLMVTEKPYLDAQLSLPQLSKQQGVSANYVSQVINEQLNENFFEFINGYRVRDAKAMLDDENRKRENILTIALESGFKSKSSFYTAFKKHTGVTPGAYRKRA